MKGRILGLSLVSAAAALLAVLSVPPTRTGPADVGAPARDPVSTGRPDVVSAVPEPSVPRAPVVSCRVFESDAPDAVGFRGVGYEAKVTSSGLDLKGTDFELSLRGASVEQGGQSFELARGRVRHEAFGRARIEHPLLTEEYVFENHRLEQLFHIPAPLGAGPLRIHSSVGTTLAGPVTRETLKGWREMPEEGDGLIFHNDRGEKKLAYHGAVAIDAAGRRCPLNPQYDGGSITLEVPESFLACASWPVVVDPWLELDFSASGGGVSRTSAVSQTPALAIEGGGNPYVAWAEEVGGNFEIYVRYWNGFSWFALGSSDQGGGISANAGNSTNPSIAVTPEGKVFVAWQDDTSGNFEIYLKEWNGSSWVALKGSASGGGVSQSLGESTHPSVAYMRVTVPSKGTVHTVPVVAWQDTTTGPTSIHLAAYFPGDPGQAPDSMNSIPNFPIIYEGWYDIGGSGVWNLGGLSQTQGGYVSEKPALAIHGTGTTARVANIVWQDTRDMNYEIYFGQCQIPDDGSTPPGSWPTFPNSKPPDFSIGGVWNLENVSDTGPGDVAREATGLSLNPSLALDAAGSPYVAWEESYDATLSNMEIRAAHGIGLWNPIGSDYNVSGTAEKSTTPSISVGQDGTAYVAWADDEPGNTEIYIKKCTPGNAWESVGFDPSFGIYSAGLGGISRTFSASLFPVVKAGARPVVVWQDFANEQFDIYLRRYYENEPRNLRQMVTLGSPPETSQLPFGGSTTVQTVELRATLFSEDENRMVRLQVEVRPVDSPFVGTVTAQSDLLRVDSENHLTDQEAVVLFTGLTNTSYHWRARTVDDLGRCSAWVSAGYNSDGTADFTVNALPPTPPAPPTNLVAQANGMQIQLAWTPPAGGTAETYEIYRSTSSPVEVNLGNFLVGGLTATTHVDSKDLSPDKTYYYVVLALDAAKQRSAPSNEASATTPSPLSEAPGNVQASGGYNEITLSWDAVAGATSYEIKRASSGAGPFATLASGVTATTYTDGGLPASTTYYYRVAAWNGVGPGPDSEVAWATTAAPSAPSPPTNLTAVGGEKQVSLTWSPSTGTPPFTYNVKRSSVSGGPYTTIATGVTTTGFTDGGLLPATTYYYVVTGVNGLGESAPSNQASATTNLLSGPPPAPENLTAASAGPTSIQLAWSAVTGAGPVVYNVSQGLAAAGPFSTIATGLSGTSHTVTGLVTGTEYFFVVTAQNGSGTGPASNVASAVPLAPPASAPTGVQATGGDRQITVRWDSLEGAISYDVKRGLSATGTFTTVANVTGTSYTDTGLPYETTYYYRVAARNAAGSGPDSEAVSATTFQEEDHRHCGLLGLEALLLLGVLGGLRRRGR